MDSKDHNEHQGAGQVPRSDEPPPLSKLFWVAREFWQKGEYEREEEAKDQHPDREV